MPPRKRKSESAIVADETSTKRARNPDSATPESNENDTPKDATPAGTGEKRKRGRPRKFPLSDAPQPPPGPKRGRGRPRKETSGTQTSAPNTPKEPSRGRGRPRKYQVQNGDEEEEAALSGSPDTKPEVDETTGRSYWLMKAEPESRYEKGVDVKFSIDDLRDRTKPEPWDGVRNLVARNHMRAMKKGDHAFFYHSNCKVPGIVGMMEIVQEHTPDESAFDVAHPYFDEKSNRNNPKWDVVHVEFRRKFNKMVTLEDLKSHGGSGEPLADLQTLKQSRLSVSSVTPSQWHYIMELAGEQPEASSKDEASSEEGAESSE